MKFSKEKIKKECWKVFLILVTMSSCVLIGAILQMQYFPTPVKTVTVTKQLPFCPLNDDMIVMASYIKKKNSASPTTIIAKIAYETILISKKKHLPPELILSIIQTESNFDPYAISSKSARGLMQVLTSECGEVIDTNYIHDIGYNIECGTCILVDKLEKGKGDLNIALFNYVGRDGTNVKESGYVDKVYRGIGEYVLFKNSITLAEAKEIVFKADIAQER
jgi:soluble lytic murein transglycosylase-like protein